MPDLKETAVNLKKAVAAEDYDNAASLLRQYCHDMDSLLSDTSHDRLELLTGALSLIPALVQQVRVSRSHHVRQLSLIRTSKQYQPHSVVPSLTNLVG